MPVLQSFDARKRPEVVTLHSSLLVGGWMLSDCEQLPYTRPMKALTLILAGLTAAACETRAAEQAAATLTIENLIDIKHPSNPVWSPDGKRVLFTWDRAGISNLYVGDGASPPKAITTYENGGAGGAFWADAQTILFTRGGDLYRVSAQGGSPTAVWTTPGAETNISLAPDGKRVAFVRAGRPNGADLIVRGLTDPKETVLAHDANSINGVNWSPDGKHVSYAAGASSIRHEQTPDYSGAKIIYTITERTPSQAFVVAATGGKATAIGTPGGGGVRWLDASHVVFDRTSPDFKKRTNFVADIATGASRIAREDVDEKFWSITGDAGAGLLPSPDGKWLAVVSDRDGWDHIYVMPAAGGDAVVTVATPLPFRATVAPRLVPLSLNCTLPDGVPAEEVTVAVKVTV